MKIQFKKLVWESGGIGKSRCAVGLFLFLITEEQDDLFFLEVTDIDCTHIFLVAWRETLDEAKKKAQNWLESQLTQFIETSENPAQ